MDLTRLWLQIKANKTIIGSGVAALLVYFVTNPNDPVVKFLTAQFPHAVGIITAVSAFLIGSGILKRDKDVKRDIKIYDNPDYTERQVDIKPTENDGLAQVKTGVSSEPLPNYKGKGNINGK